MFGRSKKEKSTQSAQSAQSASSSQKSGARSCGGRCSDSKASGTRSTRSCN